MDRNEADVAELRQELVVVQVSLSRRAVDVPHEKGRACFHDGGERFRSLGLDLATKKNGGRSSRGGGRGGRGGDRAASRVAVARAFSAKSSKGLRDSREKLDEGDSREKLDEGRLTPGYCRAGCT